MGYGPLDRLILLQVPAGFDHLARGAARIEGLEFHLDLGKDQVELIEGQLLPLLPAGLVGADQDLAQPVDQVVLPLAGRRCA